MAFEKLLETSVVVDTTFAMDIYRWVCIVVVVAVIQVRRNRFGKFAGQHRNVNCTHVVHNENESNI